MIFCIKGKPGVLTRATAPSVNFVADSIGSLENIAAGVVGKVFMDDKS